MKIKFLILLCLLSSSFTFSNEQQEEVAHIDAPSEETTTLVVTDYLDKMREKCDFGVSEFERIGEALTSNTHHLINPIPQEQAELSSQCFAYWQGWNKLIEITNHHPFYPNRVLAKTEQIIAEIEEDEYDRECAEKKTANINIEMAFVTIPKQNYNNDFIGEFAITNDIEIQETPVTQYQWAKVIGNNPAYFKTGEHARHVDIDGQELEMCPNKPVECVSYNDITEFITRLNEQDDVYNYSLPSLEEYLAIASLGNQRATSSCLNQKTTCHVEFSDYITIGKKRLYALTSNVREFTRDSLQSNLPNNNIKNYLYSIVNSIVSSVFSSNSQKTSLEINKLLFGTFYASIGNELDKLSSLTRPIYYLDTSAPDIGFRLTRHKKTAEPKLGEEYELQWTREEIGNDEFYLWDKIARLPVHGMNGGKWELENKCDIGSFGWMLEHKKFYPESTQHTIEVLLEKAREKAEGALPSIYLTNLTDLDLWHNDIIDLTPLVSLTNLTDLDLSNNQIIDLAPLQSLTNLTSLDLSDNQIIDIAPLALLTNLTSLYLRSNKIIDIAPLQYLTNLTYLDLRSNKIIDIAPLQYLTNLTILYLGKNKIIDIAPLQSLTKLTWLQLRHNQIIDIAPLQYLTNLTYLSLGANPISNWSPLNELERNGCTIYR